MSKSFPLVLVAVMVGACATSPDSTPTAAQSAPVEKEYRTGSRIPVRDPAASAASPAKTLDASALGMGAPARTN
jgi:hypothetical protein